jgi:hypothetical protein
MSSNVHIGTADRNSKREFYADLGAKPRLAKVDPEGVPEELKLIDQWVVWNLKKKVDKVGVGKWDKPPYQLSGQKASSTNPDTWTTFDAALAAHERGKFDGIGFVLANGYAGVDLDNVVDPETRQGISEAKSLVRQFGTYAEISPSGTGVKLIGKGSWPGEWHKKPFGGVGEIEVYDKGRYFTVTGDGVTDHQVADIQGPLDALVLEYAAEHGTAAPDRGAVPCPRGDDELLARAGAAKNGERFVRLWKGNTSDYGGNASGADLALCGMLAFWCGGDARAVDRLFRKSGLMRPKWDERRGDSTYGERTVRKSLKGRTAVGEQMGPGHRPAIIIGTDEYRVSDEAVEALTRVPDLYERAGMLVQVVDAETAPDPAAGVVRRPVPVPAIRELSPPLLRDLLTRCASWFDKREAKLRPAHVPVWAVQSVHARRTWPGVRKLETIVTHPVLLPDGSLLDADGYHAPTGVMVRLPGGVRAAVRGAPTREDVAAAVAVLADVVCDFPFATPGHRAAWVAALLTPLAWFAFDGPAPWFVVDKNVRGAGAGLLVDVVALTLTGRRFPVMSYTPDREEFRKRITALAAEGERLVLLDNLAGAVGHDVLDAALTSDLWKDRLLGGNRVFNGALHMVWFGTGNNVQVQADTARRVCPIRMETLEERPELRTGFRYPDLRAHVRENRGRLLSAALTILRGWVAAGRPGHGLPAWGSFEGWSGVVREAVVFAGLPDPGETRAALQTAADRDAVTMAAVLAALRGMDPDGRGVTTAEIIEAARRPDPAPWAAEVKCAVEELCPRLDAAALGYRFRHFKGRNFGGWMLDKATTDHGTNRWVVRRVAGL